MDIAHIYSNMATKTMKNLTDKDIDCFDMTNQLLKYPLILENKNCKHFLMKKIPCTH